MSVWSTFSAGIQKVQERLDQVLGDEELEVNIPLSDHCVIIINEV